MEQQLQLQDSATFVGLGQRESQILKQIRLLGSASAVSLLQQLGVGIKRSTVVSILRRLEAKGYLTHRRQGRRYIFWPIQARQSSVESILQHQLTPPVCNLVNGFRNWTHDRNASDFSQSELSLEAAQLHLDIDSKMLGSISAQEKAVLRLLADGHTNKTIAANLNLSPRTIEAHRWQLTKKLRMQSVAELTKFAIRSGLSQL
jgi:DNA-binding CsgD family transcriptional regulator/predicted transcriptional regulator